MTDRPFISVAAAARELGLNRSTLSRQVKDGRIRSHAGRVVLEEVIQDRRQNFRHRVSLRSNIRPAAGKAFRGVVQNSQAMDECINRLDPIFASLDDPDALFAMQFCLARQVAFMFEEGDDDEELSFEQAEAITVKTVMRMAGAIKDLVLCELREQRAAIVLAEAGS
jgi:hypothetical protein